MLFFVLFYFILCHKRTKCLPMGGAKSLASSFSFSKRKKIKSLWDTSILGMDDEAFDGTFLGVRL